MKIKKIGIGVALALVFVVGFGFYAKDQAKQALADILNAAFIPKMSTSTAVMALTSSTDILSSSTARVYAIIVNDGLTPVYLGLDGKVAVVDAGIRLNASGGAYEINQLNNYLGTIRAIASGTPALLTVTAFQ